jgi:hypothetical protein
MDCPLKAFTNSKLNKIEPYYLSSPVVLFFQDSKFELINLAQSLKLNWKQELAIIFVILLIMIVVLFVATYYSCGNDNLACIINFIT